MDEEFSAIHEAGHAFMAIYLGGRVASVSLEPEQDDDEIARFADVRVEWPHAEFSQRQIIENSLMVAIAGPVAEMIYRGEPLHPGFVPEWSADWKAAWQCAATLVNDETKRLKLLEAIVLKLKDLLEREHHWAAVSAVADRLAAFDTLEHDEVAEEVGYWLRNG